MLPFLLFQPIHLQNNLFLPFQSLLYFFSLFSFQLCVIFPFYVFAAFKNTFFTCTSNFIISVSVVVFLHFLSSNTITIDGYCSLSCFFFYINYFYSNYNSFSLTPFPFTIPICVCIIYYFFFFYHPKIRSTCLFGLCYYFTIHYNHIFFYYQHHHLFINSFNIQI